MQDDAEVDRLLRRLFAASRTPLPAADFLAALERQLHRAQRRRLLWSAGAWAALTVSAVLLTPLVVSTSLALAGYYLQGARGLEVALLSPLGLLCMLAASLLVLRRVRTYLA